MQQLDTEQRTILELCEKIIELERSFSKLEAKDWLRLQKELLDHKSSRDNHYNNVIIFIAYGSLFYLWSSTYETQPYYYALIVGSCAFISVFFYVLSNLLNTHIASMNGLICQLTMKEVNEKQISTVGVFREIYQKHHQNFLSKHKLFRLLVENNAKNYIKFYAVQFYIATTTGLIAAAMLLVAFFFFLI